MRRSPVIFDPDSVGDDQHAANGARKGAWDWALDLESQRLQGLLRAWRDKCTGDRLPARRDFDPLDLRAFLGAMFLLVADREDDDFRYTLIGTEIVNNVGVDSTGRTVGDMFGANGLELYRTSRDTRRPVRVHGVLDWHGKAFKRYETVILPLADDGETVDRFLGGMVFE